MKIESADQLCNEILASITPEETASIMRRVYAARNLTDDDLDRISAALVAAAKRSASEVDQLEQERRRRHA